MADFEEDAHPRGADGKFTSGGGGDAKALKTWAEKRAEAPKPVARTFSEQARGLPAGSATTVSTHGREKTVELADHVLREVGAHGNGVSTKSLEERLSGNGLQARITNVGKAKGGYHELEFTFHDDKGENVGMVQFSFGDRNLGGDVLKLENAFLDEAHQGTGAGKRTVKTLIETAKAAGMNSIGLEAHEHGTEVWPRLGFTTEAGGIGAGALSITNRISRGHWYDTDETSKRLLQVTKEFDEAIKKVPPWEIHKLRREDPIFDGIRSLPSKPYEAASNYENDVKKYIDSGEWGRALLRSGSASKLTLSLKDGDPAYEHAKKKLGL